MFSMWQSTWNAQKWPANQWGPNWNTFISTSASITFLIQLITEESLIQINDLSENMLNELDEYEQKLLLTTEYESNRSNLNLLQNHLNFHKK